MGQIITGPRADAMRRALQVPAVVGTPVLVGDGVQSLGFALGPPAAPPGTVVYRETVIKPGTPTPTTASAPFSELEVSLYAVPRPDPAQLLLTTGHPGEQVVRSGALLRPIAAGDNHWLLSVVAEKPLIGPVVQRLPLITLVLRGRDPAGR